MEVPTPKREAATREVAVVHYLHRLEDGTCVVLYRLRRDAGHVAEILAEIPDAVAWDARSSGKWVHLLLRFRPIDTADRLFDAVDGHSIALVFPLRCTAGGGFRVTAVGPESALDSATARLPSTVGVDIPASVSTARTATSSVSGSLTGNRRYSRPPSPPATTRYRNG
jgi:hypothetical protein